MVERKIIQVDDSAPLISKKKKRQAAIAFGIVAAIVAVIVVFIVAGTTQKIQTIGDYRVTKVTKGSLTTSTEASGTVVLPTQVSIVNMSEGYADKLNVSVGDSVTTDTVLAELDVPDLEKDKVDLENSLETQEIALEQVLVSNKYTIKELEISIKRVEADIIDAKEDLEKAKSLMSLKSSRESDYEDAFDKLTALEEQREDLELNLEKAKKEGELNVRSKETQIRQNELNLERLNEDIEDSKITSPINGSVLNISEKLSVPGSLISQSTELFTVANTDDVYIDLEVYEQYRSVLEVGNKMEVVISSTVIEAEIIQIGSVASVSSDSLSATIEVRAKPVGDVDLTVGASAAAEIPLGTKENALLLPRGSYLTSGNQAYLYVVEGDVAVKTKVTYGTISGDKVEILSGVEAGDQVIISSYQNFIDQEEIKLEK
ncbi:efflux RND transporter periplasmic adaptor subunit [Thiospirochaeta perfilievii]|nr:efflux RND transporter periplasmic adaptor subunit [Thiospirochaeta perfilievii]